MNLKQLLALKGFVEGKDFSIEGKAITPLEQVIPGLREVQDEQGNIVQAEVPETRFFAEIPPLENLLLECVVSSDPDSLASMYVEPFKATIVPGDSLNIHLFLNGGDGWRFEKVPAPTLEQLYDLIEMRDAKFSQDEVNRQSLEYLASTDWMAIRQYETGVPMPESVKLQRAEARAKVVK